MPGHIDRMLGVPDDEIVSRIRTGDNSVYNDLAKAYWQPLCKWGSFYFDSLADAEDAVASMLFELWIRRADWRVANSVESYLYGAIRRKAMAYGRDRRRREELLEAQFEMGIAPGMGVDEESPDSAVLGEDYHSKIQQAVDTLPLRYRAVLALRVQKDMGYGDIAQIMEVSEATARVLVTRALQALKKRLTAGPGLL